MLIYALMFLKLVFNSQIQADVKIANCLMVIMSIIY